MPTLVVDQDATYDLMLLMGSAAKIKYGSDAEVATNAAGVKQWSCTVSVNYRRENPADRLMSDSLTVTIASNDDPFAGIDPGSQVRFDNLRAGLSAPERGDGDRIRGGKLWFNATGIRTLSPIGHRPKADG